jgi:hypothetical protein
MDTYVPFGVKRRMGYSRRIAINLPPKRPNKAEFTKYLQGLAAIGKRQVTTPVSYLQSGYNAMKAFFGFAVPAGVPEVAVATGIAAVVIPSTVSKAESIEVGEPKKAIRVESVAHVKSSGGGGGGGGGSYGGSYEESNGGLYLLGGAALLLFLSR